MNAVHTIGIYTLAVASNAVWTDWRKVADDSSGRCRECHQTVRAALGKCDQSVMLSSWWKSKFAIPLISIQQTLIFQTLSPEKYQRCRVASQMLIEKRAARCVRVA
jgi:hypothetical protein